MKLLVLGGTKNHWGEALAHGEPLECAARPDQPIQYVDARDYVAWVQDGNVPPPPPHDT